MSEIDPFRILALAVHPRWVGVVYAGTWESGDSGRVLGSVDGGRTWSEMDEGRSRTPVHALAVDPVTSDTVYLGGPHGILKRSAGEEGWSAAGLTESVDALAVDANGTIHAGAWATRDQGESWEVARHGPWAGLAIDPVDARTMYAGSSADEIFRSGDGGRTWTRCAALPLEEWQDPYDWGWLGALSFDPSTPGAVYGSGAGGLFRTVDEGRSWTNVQRGVVWSVVAHAGPPATVYTGSSSICRSVDGCRSWTCVDPRAGR